MQILQTWTKLPFHALFSILMFMFNWRIVACQTYIPGASLGWVNGCNRIHQFSLKTRVKRYFAPMHWNSQWLIRHPAPINWNSYRRLCYRLGSPPSLLTILQFTFIWLFNENQGSITLAWNFHEPGFSLSASSLNTMMMIGSTEKSWL